MSKIIHNGLQAKIKKGVIKTIEGQKPFAYVASVSDGIAVIFNYIIKDYYIIFMEAHSFPEGLAITDSEKMIIGSAEATNHIESIINDTHVLANYGMMSLKQKQRMDALLSQYYILNDTALIDLIREGEEYDA